MFLLTALSQTAVFCADQDLQNRKHVNIGEDKAAALALTSKPPVTRSPLGIGIAIGVAVGAALGVAINNIAVGLVIGVLLGVALGAVIGRRSAGKR